MATLKCNTCGGVYDDVLVDGAAYFHSCAPLTGEALRQAVRDGVVTLRGRDQVALDEAIDADAKGVLVTGAVGHVDALFASLSYPRPDARNENVDLVKAKAATGEDGTRIKGTRAADLIKSAGQGVTVLKG